MNIWIFLDRNLFAIAVFGLTFVTIIGVTVYMTTKPNQADPPPNCVAIDRSDHSCQLYDDTLTEILMRSSMTEPTYPAWYCHQDMRFVRCKKRGTDIPSMPVALSGNVCALDGTDRQICAKLPKDPVHLDKPPENPDH